VSPRGAHKKAEIAEFGRGIREMNVDPYRPRGLRNKILPRPNARRATSKRKEKKRSWINLPPTKNMDWLRKKGSLSGVTGKLGGLFSC